MVRIERIFMVDSCDDPAFKVAGFYSLGHIYSKIFLESNQLWEYIGEYNEYNDLDEEEQLNPQNLPQLKHIHWVIEKAYPDEPECDCEVFVRCPATHAGAIAVTVLDV